MCGLGARGAAAYSALPPPTRLKRGSSPAPFNMPANENRGPGTARTRGHSQGHPLALPPGRWFQGQLQLILTVTFQQVCHSPTYEPGERHAVLLCERRQLLVVPLVDADRDPRGKSLPPPGSHRSYPPKRCISVMRHDAHYCITMLRVKRYFNDPAKIDSGKLG